ncbi:nucleotidyltransferase [candidate division KSB1 bacterium]|nr:MAG: nucleotidyltransferase [candidate division KSB1 bacterium]
MNIQALFEDFLDKVVNLNKDRVNRIRNAQSVLTNFIKGQDDFEKLYIDTIPQGSYRQKTIIRPIGANGTFDVDLLVRLIENPDWSPAEYITRLADAFRNSGRYKDLTDTYGKTRCVTIDYEGDFHVDLVPAVERSGEFCICNKTTDKFEVTDGDGYAQWFEQQDATANGRLVPVVRLIKYLRDSKGQFDTKSIILTTVAGMQVWSGDNFSSLPTALSTILTRMNEFFSQFDNVPSIPNPAMPGENFDRHWKNDRQGFNKLKTAIGAYADIAAEAVSTTDSAEAVKRWRKPFGDEFPSSDSIGKGVTGSVASSIGSSTVSRSFTPHSPYAFEK